MKRKIPLLVYILVYTISITNTEELEKGENIQFTEEDIDIVIQSHNQLRAQNITPPASNMRELSWDPNLAKFSEEWTINCRYSFKENTTTELWSSAGQSFFLASAAWHVDFHYSSVITWLGQSSLFTYENGSCSDFCGHYLQLAYADTYKVGCAATYCPLVATSGSDRKIENGTMYMCAYYPAAPSDGGYQPYKKGPACSNCSDPTDTCSDLNLCTNPQRAKPLTKPQKIPEGDTGGGFSFKTGWTVLEKALAGVGAGAALLGMIAAAVKMFKGTSVAPSSAPSPDTQVGEEQNVTNGKAPTNPVEGGEN